MEDILSWFAKETAQHLILHYISYLGALLFTGGGLVLGVLMFGRRYKERIARMEGELAVLRKQSEPPTLNVNHEDLGYEVITWWGETGDTLIDAGFPESRKRFPKTIRDKRTGTLHEVPHPIEPHRRFTP